MTSSRRTKEPVLFTVVIPNRIESTYGEKTKNEKTDLRHKLRSRSEEAPGNRNVSDEIDDVLSILKRTSHGKVQYHRHKTLSEEDLPPMNVLPHDQRHRNTLNRVCRNSPDSGTLRRNSGQSQDQKSNETLSPVKSSPRKTKSSPRKTLRSVISKVDHSVYDETKSEGLFADLNKSLDLIEDFEFVNDSMSILSIEQKNKRLGLSNIETEKQRHEAFFRKSAEQSLAHYEAWSTNAKIKCEQQVKQLKDRNLKKDSTIESEYAKLQEYYQTKFKEGQAIIQHVEESEKKKLEEEANRQKQVQQSWNNIVTYERTTFEVLNATRKCVPDPRIDPEIESLFKEIGDLQTSSTSTKNDVAKIYSAGELGPQTALQYEQKMYDMYSKVMIIVEKLNGAIKRVNLEIATKASTDPNYATTEPQNTTSQYTTSQTQNTALNAQNTTSQTQNTTSNSQQADIKPSASLLQKSDSNEVKSEIAHKTEVPSARPDKASAELDVKKNIISASAFQLNQKLEENLQTIQKDIEKLVLSKEKEVCQMRSALKLITVTPINSISASSTQHMKNKVMELSSILDGKETTRNDKTINPGLNNLTLNYCFDVAASKFVDQACEQVAFSDNLVPAFSIAAVLTGIWQNHPKFGKLFLAQLHRRCPYAIPAHWPKKPTEDNCAYLRRLGYSMDGEQVEENDKFLEKMTGCIKLYGGIIVTPAPFSDKPHPHGLSYGWLWLSRVLNLEPMADVTATMIEAFLSVAGSALHQKYKSQFLKLLDSLYTQYLPKLEAVTDPKHLGPITRLKLYLEKVNKDKALPVPNGRITHSICS